MKLTHWIYRILSGLLLLLFMPVVALLIYHIPGSKPVRNPVVEIRKENDRYVLYRHGKPYFIKGVGGYEHMDKMALYGANSVRTWRTDKAEQILNEADKYGLTVTLGLEVGKEWWGEDFNYLDFEAVDHKIEELKTIVEQYRSHPALLMWNVGNEVHLFGGNQIVVLYTINRIARMIHETDPDHPVMTSVPLGPNFNKRGIMRLLCPDLDVLGVNGFSKLHRVSEDVRNLLGWNKPYILTEWAAPGPWEMKSTYWGAPIELSSAHKAKYIDKYWDILSEDNSLYLGGYGFYWGQKYERTHTFFSLFPEGGYETESVQVLKAKWTGKDIDNWAPRIDSVIIHTVRSQDNQYLTANEKYSASIYAHDPDKDTLTYKWELRPEGKDNFKPGNYYHDLNYLLSDNYTQTVRFVSPGQEGGYRLFAYVYDKHAHVATYNIPFYVLMQ
jgi:hypothetical protein